MAKKRDTNLITSGQLLEITGLSKAIIKPQKVAPINLETPKDQLEKRSISYRKEGFNPHSTTGMYSSLHCCTATVIFGILDCLPSGNPVLFVSSIQGDIFTDQSDIYIYIIGNIDHDTAADLQRCLKDKKHKWLKVTTQSGTYQTPTKSPMLHNE